MRFLSITVALALPMFLMAQDPIVPKKPPQAPRQPRLAQAPRPPQAPVVVVKATDPFAPASKVVAKKKCPVNGADCKCGCLEGGKCSCAAKKKKDVKEDGKKICPCSKLCTCGCNDGKRCRCADQALTRAAPVGQDYQPAPPVYYYQPPMMMGGFRGGRGGGGGC